ncbi:MAG: glycosyltransferase family 4 protein [Candidatus Harrisonbacteria bacterium]|nr:glycosyltransferase family 4 protein [Candidatus Harrisonbacteria bacterium]
MKQRILIFSSNYFPYIGGAEVAIHEITRRLKDDFNFDLICPRYSKELKKEEIIGSVHVYRVGLGNRLDKFLVPFLGFRKARQLKKTHIYSLFWAMMASHASLAAARAQKAFQKPLVLTLQEGDDEAHLKRYVLGSDVLYRLLIRPLHYLAMRRAQDITVISRWLEKRARQANPKARIHLIPNGVDLKRFTQTIPQEQRTMMRKDLGLGEEDFLIISTSRLVKKNDIASLILSLKHLPRHHYLALIGSGQLEKDLKKLAQKEGLAQRVFFLGKKKQEEILPYLRSADVFVRPSLSEGMGISFLEAMAAELPVVATSVGGIEDFLLDSKTGFVCKVKDPRSIAEQVLLVGERADLRASVVQNARAMVESRYNWNAIARQMKDVFDTML